MIYEVEVLKEMANSKKVHLIGEVSDEMLLNFSLVSPMLQDDTELWITSPGGSLDICLALTDMINLNKKITKLIVTGEAASAGAIIFLASKKKKFMTPKSTIMIHQATLESTARSMHEYAEKMLILKESNELIKAIVQDALPAKKTREMEDFLATFDGGRDLFVTSEKCLKWKLIDGIYK